MQRVLANYSGIALGGAFFYALAPLLAKAAVYLLFKSKELLQCLSIMRLGSY